MTHLKLRARNRVLVPHNLPLVSRGLLVISRYCEPKFVQVMNQEFFTVNDGLPTTQNVRPPSSYLTLCPAGPPCNAGRPAPARDQLHRRGNQPLGAGLGRSAYPALAGQLPHPALRDARLPNSCTARQVGSTCSMMVRAISCQRGSATQPQGRRSRSHFGSLPLAGALWPSPRSWHLRS